MIRAESVSHSQGWRSGRLDWRGAGVCAVASLCLLIVGCGRCVIEGQVVDVAGDALPGVAVETASGEHFALTDGCGRYAVVFTPGAVDVSFLKSGYTPGYLHLDIQEPRKVEATTVRLWRVPMSKGVYLFDNNRYRPLMFVEPQVYCTEGARAVYGTPREPELESASTEPFLMSFKMPRFDAKLCRLDKQDMRPTDSPDPDFTIPAWIPAEEIPLTAEPVDEPEATLVQLSYPSPLEPGVYAIHWGALNGFAAAEARAFIFRVVGPEEPQASGPEESEAPAEDVPKE